MPGVVPAPGFTAKDLASPSTGGATRPKAAAYNMPSPPTTSGAAAFVPADVFQTFRMVRDALILHCPGALNHAARLARETRRLV